MRCPLGGFGNPSGFDALRADFDALDGAVGHFRAHFLQIGQPTSFGFVVGMAHAMTIQRTFAANFTTFHDDFLVSNLLFNEINF